ncbi:MAG TPA: TonB-dependent receptor [Povalibacter sp.]|uniref:TonB-dependent receptor n=1 Tax=Povalibacter sp. TaxID=1962978 RepID=UPI002B5C977F|nr:TonB-dependent receptor [Povalibacter sp.]HMN47123.1 TonB-dependent receptor [Povalibacter sp.]
MRFILACAAASACLPVLAVAAQEPADRSTSEATTLEGVIVTARRRQEDLQSVPAAVSVVDGNVLDSSYTVNTQQLSQLVPSLYYNSANPRNTAYTIRGLGSNTLSISAANDGIEPGVGFYVDQVYHGRPATAAFDFTDIERVEVLRGPQGTLFGKNTTAGAIHVISREPGFEPEGNAEVSYGDEDFVQAKGAISGGLFRDVVAGRLAAQITQRDGLLTNVNTGEKLNELDNYAVRAQLLFVPTDNLRLRLIGDVSDLDSACCTQNFLRVGQSLRSPSRQFPALAAGLGYAPPSTDVYDRLSDIDAALHVDTQDGGVSLIADWDVGAVTLTSVTAWRYWDWDVANDRDYTGIPIQRVQRIPSRQDQYSQEFRIASNGDTRFSYVAGLYYYSQEISGHPTSIYGPEAAYWLLNQANFTVPIPRNLLDGYGQEGDSRFEMDSYAAFGEVNYAFTDRLTATLGLRYTYEDKEGSYATRVFGGLDLTGLPPATAAELARAKLSIFRPQSYTAADDGGSLSGRANLAYRFADDLMGYVSFAHGYKSGGLNMSGLPLDALNQPALATAVIEDEINTTYELGLKFAMLDSRATLNLAGYWTVVEDYQANIVSNLETAAIRSYPSNIPEVQVKGVEADFAMLLFAGLTVRASVAYADGEYADYRGGPCPLEVQTAATVACDLTGESLAGLSDWVESLGIDYALPLGSGALVAHVDSNWRSGYNSDTSGSRYTRIDGYNVTNASVGYRFQSGWEVDVFARNLFDADYITALTIQTGNSGLILGQPSDPRLVGVTVRTRF